MFDKTKFKEDGFLLIPEYYNIDTDMINNAKSIMSDKAYTGGRRYLTHNLDNVRKDLRSLVVTTEIAEFLNHFTKEEISCKDIMLTYDYKHEVKTRNKWLHFDRWRSLKALVYLTDVEEDMGPFSVVPGSHVTGAAMRRSFRSLPYDRRPNRIELDYPGFYKKPLKLLGKAGTLILFDSDIFHMGGNISPNKERILIRSHWYVDRSWQEVC